MTTTKNIANIRNPLDNKGMAEVTVQCSLNRFLGNQSLVFSINHAINGMVKIATLAKLENNNERLQSKYANLKSLPNS